MDEMWRDYVIRNPENSVHYTTYLRCVPSKNITFATLGMEECEMCDEIELMEHDKVDGTCLVTRKPCNKRSSHRVAYTEARQAYEADGNSVADG